MPIRTAGYWERRLGLGMILLNLFLREFGSGAVLNAVFESEKAQTISGAF